MATDKQIKYWESLKGKRLSVETRNKMSSAKKGIKPSNFDSFLAKGHEQRPTQVGENAANWKGGISRGRAYKLVIKVHCQECGTTDKKLHIHHIDKNPRNNVIENLKVLCTKCHIGMHNKERKSWLSLPVHKEKDKIT